MKFVENCTKFMAFGFLAAMAILLFVLTFAACAV